MSLILRISFLKKCILICRWVFLRCVAVPAGSVKAAFAAQTVEAVIFAWTNPSLVAEIKKDRNAVCDSVKERLWWASKILF